MGEEGLNLDGGSGGGGVVMDTPERKQITSPISKFEDSPVFNYLNSLSPIKPVKSMHITHTFNSLSFASLPSVFTSPHVSSLKESRFLRRHQFSDPSKPEFSSENGNKVGRNEEVINVAHKSAEQQQNFDPGSSSGEASAEPPYESSLAIELSRTLSYECASPDCDPTTQCGMETRGVPELNGSSTALVPYVQVDSGSEVHMGGMTQIDENKDPAGCDWENMFSDGTDLLMFDSPNDSKCLTDPSQKLLEPGTSFCTSLTDVQNAGAIEAVGLSQEHEADNTSSQYENGRHIKEIAEDQDILVSLCNSEAGDTSEKVDDELASNLQRGMRRRCLVFEMVGCRRKQFDDGSSCGPSMLSQSHDNIASNDKRLIPFKPGNDTPRRVLPGIGLHLNALAATSADNKVVKHEALVTGGQPISVSRSAAYFNSLNSQEISNNSLVVSSSEREMVPAEGGAPIVEDAAQTSGYAVNEVFNHSSPKKKRRRLENAGDSETACKRCNCKKSKCLKLYCECFAAGVYCVEPCSCQECFNKPIHEDTVLATRKQIESRNPLAFAPKVIRSSDSIIEIGEESSKTPASARHKRGCNCKKSGCLKKYCECYQGGVGCSINCRCEGCKNAFGRKDGSTSIGPEELEEEEVEECERSVADKSLQIITTPNDAEQNTNFAIPATPLQFGRQSIQLPVSSQSKRPPRSSFLAIGSSSGLYGSQRFGKLNPLPPQGKFEKHFQTARDDEMPEILQRSGSPISGVKSASPNSKRVSPPHSNIGLSPGQRSSRKLILQSIPSFPSLTPKH